MRSKLGLKALGLCVVVLGLMASAAQAETGANWMVNGTNVNATLLPEVVGNIENNDATLLTKILGILTHILCTAGVLKETKLLPNGVVAKEVNGKGETIGGKVSFSGCATSLEEGGKMVVSKPCLPKTAGVADTIETNAGVGLLKLHLLVAGGAVESLTYIKSQTGGALATVESTEECAVGQKINITGELVLKDTTGVTNELVTHLIVESPLSTLKASGQVATIDGSAEVKLNGVGHVTLKWSGLPSATKP